MSPKDIIESAYGKNPWLTMVVVALLSGGTVGTTHLFDGGITIPETMDSNIVIMLIVAVFLITMVFNSKVGARALRDLVSVGAETLKGIGRDCHDHNTRREEKMIEDARTSRAVAMELAQAVGELTNYMKALNGPPKKRPVIEKGLET